MNTLFCRICAHEPGCCSQDWPNSGPVLAWAVPYHTLCYRRWFCAHDDNITWKCFLTCQWSIAQHGIVAPANNTCTLVFRWVISWANVFYNQGCRNGLYTILLESFPLMINYYYFAHSSFDTLKPEQKYSYFAVDFSTDFLIVPNYISIKTQWSVSIRVKLTMF